MKDSADVETKKNVTLWWRPGEASDRLQDELQRAGYHVERCWSAETEPAVSNGVYFSRGYGNIYERFLSSPISAGAERLVRKVG